MRFSFSQDFQKRGLFMHTNNPVNEFKSQTFVRIASAYMYMLERVGYRDFSNANR